MCPGKILKGENFIADFMFGATPGFSSIIRACFCTAKCEPGNRSLSRVGGNVEEFQCLVTVC